MQFYYDRKLLKIGSIVEEAVERKRKAMYLFIKIIQEFKYYINTGYELSKISYRGQDNHLAETE